MKGLFGWHANPERLRVIAYLVYLVPVVAIYLKPPVPVPVPNNEKE